jgi:hypothetical protein
VEHGREQEEVFFANERDFDIGIAPFFELERRVETAKAAAKDENTSLFHGFLVFLSGFSPAVRSNKHRRVQVLSGS